MRHVPLKDLIEDVFDGPEGKKDERRLLRARKRLAGKADAHRKKYIDDNGSSKWSPIKSRLTDALGHKCWYTEAELVGASLTIDHYRPSSLYWWLAFEVENYRVACPFSNSKKKGNPQHGISGGKGDKFPLLPPQIRARSEAEVAAENPVILDPCKREDCDLLAFQADGRPIVNPAYEEDSIAKRRVNESKLLLNLDHPHFNAKRELLYHGIAGDVKTYEELLEGSASRRDIRRKMTDRVAAHAPFSMAARQYLRMFRHLDWVEALLNTL